MVKVGQSAGQSMYKTLSCGKLADHAFHCGLPQLSSLHQNLEVQSSAHAPPTASKVASCTWRRANSKWEKASHQSVVYPLVG
jgi:hypothetical protein